MSIPEYLTERLFLRGVSMEDVPSYTKHFVDYEVIRKLSRTAPWPYPDNGVAEYLKNVILPDQGVDRWTWGIFLRGHEDDLIGCVDLWRPGKPENRGFWLGKKYWNKGFMTEAVYPVMDFAFDDVGFDQLVFSNAAGNIGSRKIKEKTGCELIEITPQSFVDPELTEQEIWKLTRERWTDYRAAHPKNYQKKLG